MIMVRDAAGRAQFMQFRFMQPAAQRQDLLSCTAQDEVEMQTVVTFSAVVALQVPDGKCIVTGFDAVQYFCSGAGKPGDLIYCNLCSASIQTSSSSSSTGVSTTSTRAPNHSALLQPQKASAAVVTDSGFCRDGYNPYDLMAVPQRLADRRHHFVVSYHGVTQMKWVALCMPA